MSVLHRVARRARSGVVAAVGLGAVACAGLPPFGADLGRQQAAAGGARAPYATTVRYYGWIAPDAEPDDIQAGKKLVYVYVWVPANTPELGVRVVSPAQLVQRPDRHNDFVDPQAISRRASTIYFDPYVRLERCLAAITPEDITKPCAQWASLGENDDSDELPANPSGKRTNAVLRVASNADDPLKVLVRGMYRLALTNAKSGAMQGTYVAELGSASALDGVALARTPAELALRVAERNGRLADNAVPADAEATDETPADAATTAQDDGEAASDERTGAWAP
jgi:hypothetical protein